MILVASRRSQAPEMSRVVARNPRMYASAAAGLAWLVLLAACAEPTKPIRAISHSGTRPSAETIDVGGGFDDASNSGSVPGTQWPGSGWQFLPAFGDHGPSGTDDCALYGRCNAGNLTNSLGSLGLSPNPDPNPGPFGTDSHSFGYMTTSSFVKGTAVAVRASAIQAEFGLGAPAFTGKGRYQLNFDYAFLTNTQAPAAGSDPYSIFQLLFDDPANGAGFDRIDQVFRISRSDLLNTPSLQQPGGCGQGGIGNAVYSLCTGWRNPTVDIPNFYNGKRFTLRLLLQDGGAPFSESDPVDRLIPDNTYASVIALDNFKLIGLPIITGTTQTPDGPVAVNTPVGLAATYEYAGPTATHTASIDWDDNTSTSPATTQSNGTGSFNSSHSYTVPGVYGARLTITDNESNVATSETPIAVYDPTVGFATGAGWIVSPAGAYTADPSLTDKAHFAFVAKLDKKTAGLVNGSASFRFQAAGFTFESNAYEWLRVAGPQAMLKGSGTVNGTGNYGFLISAVDGQLNGGLGVDKFRIKIWDSNGVVYDNQLGASESAEPATALGGGSITIKK